MYGLTTGMILRSLKEVYVVWSIELSAYSPKITDKVLWRAPNQGGIVYRQNGLEVKGRGWQGEIVECRFYLLRTISTIMLPVGLLRIKKLLQNLAHHMLASHL